MRRRQDYQGYPDSGFERGVHQSGKTLTKFCLAESKAGVKPTKFTIPCFSIIATKLECF